MLAAQYQNLILKVVRTSDFLSGIGNAIILSVMKNILLCSSNPILVKSLYAILRDEGFYVATSEHPAFAVQMIMHTTLRLS